MPLFHRVVKLSWLDPLQPDERLLAGAVSVIEAARRADRPYGTSETVHSLRGIMRYGWDGDPPTVAVAHDEHGRVAGVTEIWLPTHDNTHFAAMSLTVDPELRRRGVGRILVQGGIDHVTALGRTVIMLQLCDHAAGTAFAGALGFERAYEEVLRRQDLLTLDRAQLDAAYVDAERSAAGYELLRLPGALPDDLISAVGRLTEAINDAPTDGLDIEDEVFTPERIRSFEAAQAARDFRTYRLLARHRDTGELAGHTVVGIDADQPWCGGQYDTSVVQAHRGHRLGLLLKIGMLRWLAEEEPQLRVIDTGNAASNAHMIAVNEKLGYQVLERRIGWQRHLDQ